MPVSLAEAQRLVNKRLPCPPVITSNGWVTEIGNEAYGLEIVQQFNRNGGWDFKFESRKPMTVAESIPSRPVTVRLPSR